MARARRPVAPAAGGGPGGASPCGADGGCRFGGDLHGAAQRGGTSEYEQLMEAMEKSGWVQAKAARMLELTPRQIGYALRKHGIPIKKF